MLTEILAFFGDGSVLVGIAAVATAVAGWLVNKRKGDITLTVDERKQLSMDEYEFRKSILTQLKACQESHSESTTEREKLRKLNIALEHRISELETNCYSCLYRASQSK